MRKLISFLPLLAILLLAAAAQSGTPAQPAALNASPGSAACGVGVGHCVQLLWSENTCTTPCTYNVYRGNKPGGENMTTPLNPAPLTVTNYVDPMKIWQNPQTYYYVVQALMTTNGVVLASGNSNEVTVTIPGVASIPPAPNVQSALYSN